MMSKPLSIETIHEVRDTCLCFRAQRLARTLARRFDLAFQPVGLTNGQFSLMMVLSGPKPPRLGHVAAFLAMDRTTLTAALKALERRGLVLVERDSEDKRGKRLSLTDAGRETLRAAIPIWRAEHAKLDAELSEIGAGSLRQLLDAIP